MLCGRQLADSVPGGVQRIGGDRSGYPRPLPEAHGLAIRSDAEPEIVPAH
jgi:hypothetical protein